MYIPYVQCKSELFISHCLSAAMCFYKPTRFRSHTSALLLTFVQRIIPCEYSNKSCAWVADNLSPVDIPFLSLVE